MSEVSRAFVTVRIARIAAVPAHLLQITAAREPPDPHSHPPEFGHKLRKTATRPGSATALRHFEDIEQQLRGNSLDAVVADFTVHPFQRQPPGVGVSSGALGSRLSKLFQKRQHHLILRLRLPPPMLGKNC
jgi:hypothetical protein